MNETKKAWFAPKRYGYGATPSTWQGWAATLVFVILFGLDLGFLKAPLSWIGAFILLVGFVVLTYVKTSAPWRWRWGDDGK
ncbi:MAG: hypothetical protein ABSC72_00460 [Methylovirgula sp.]|jgi:hypothetical protein